MYAIRDDLFCESKDRVKFFDYIIPVVSKFSKQNSKEYIKELYKEFNSKDKFEIDNKLLRIISFYIQDRRLLINIFTEFQTYVDNLSKNPDINYTELFAIICYKNLKPTDFEKRLYLEGDLYNLLDSKKRLIKLLNQELVEKNQELENKKNSIEKKQKLEQGDLKKAFVLSAIQLYNRNMNLSNVIIEIGNNQYNIEEFVSSNIQSEDIENESMNIIYESNRRQYIDISVREDYTVKLKLLECNIKHLDEEIKKNVRKIDNNYNKTIEEILNEDGIRDIMGDEKINKVLDNDLLISLFKNGFIKETYEKSISFFKEGDLSYGDYQFIIRVDTNNRMNYDYELKKIEEVVKNIEVKDFLKDSVLNFDIANFLVENYKKYKIKYKKFKEQFLNLNAYRIVFLEEYMDIDANNFKKILLDIISEDMIDYVVENMEYLKDFDKMIKFIVENVEMRLQEMSQSPIKELIDGDMVLLNSIELTEIAKTNLIYIELDIVNYENILLDKIELFYCEDMYSPNKSFYNKLLEINNLDKIDVDEKVLDIIFGDIYFENFRHKCIHMEYFNELYGSFEKYNSDEENIILALNCANLKNEDKHNIILNENQKITDIREIIDEELVVSIIENSKYYFNMQNIIGYYNIIKSIDNIILEMLVEIGDTYSYFENDIFKTFERDLIYSPINNGIIYEKIAKEFSSSIEKIEEEKLINERLLLELIKVNKISLNKEIFMKLSTINNILVELVIRKLDELIDMKNDVTISVNLIEAILNSDNSINKKIEFVDVSVIKELSEKIITSLIKQVIIENIDLEEDVIIEIFNKINETSKIDFFIYLHSRNEENYKYLSLINEKTAKIRDGITTKQVFNISYKRLMNYLEEKKIINKLVLKNGKIMISYSKNKI